MVYKRIHFLKDEKHLLEFCPTSINISSLIYPTMRYDMLNRIETGQYVELYVRNVIQFHLRR